MSTANKPKTRTPASFRFKRFTVQQESAAMKLGFDSVLLGAWARTVDSQRILDVGTGTGIVALMLAQRTETDIPQPSIDAIEIEPRAAAEAGRNFDASPWRTRLRSIPTAFESFVETRPQKYDLIVCNPPFLGSGCTSPNAARAASRHEASLSVLSVCRLAQNMILSKGRLCLIVPAGRRDELLATAADNGFHARRLLEVKPLPQKPPHRILVELSPASGSLHQESLTIEERHHEYTARFRQLTRSFYLRF